MAEIDETIALLEADLPGSAEGPEGQRLANSMEREVREYFKALDTALPVQALENLYWKHVKQE